MLRNSPGPYNISPGIGMDKEYFWDDNQRCNVLPLYPEAENCNEIHWFDTILKIQKID